MPRLISLYTTSALSPKVLSVYLEHSRSKHKLNSC